MFLGAAFRSLLWQTRSRSAFSNRERIRRSGLWNSNHVDETYAPDFLDTLTQLEERMR